MPSSMPTATLLQQAQALKDEKKPPRKVDAPEVVEVYLEFLAGNLTCKQVAKVFKTTPSSVNTTTGQFLYRCFKKGLLVWKKHPTA